MSDLKRKAIKGVRWTTFSAAVLTVGGLAQTLLFPRLVPAKDFALMGLLNVLLGLSAQLIDMGFSNAIIRENSISRERLSSFYWVNVGIGLFCCALVWLGADFLAAQFPKLPADVLAAAFRYIAPAFLLGALASQYQALLQKQLRFKLLAVIEIASFLAGFATALTLAFMGYGIMALVAGTLAKVSVNALLLIGTGLREHVPQWRFDWLDIKPSLEFGAFQVMEKTVAYLAVNFDTLLITRLLAPEVSGVYEVTKRLLIQPWYFINPVVTKVIYPVMAQVHEDVGRLRNIALRGIHLVSAINLPLYSACLLGADLLVPVLFGPKYVPSAIEPFRWLALAFMVRAVFNPLGSVILAKGKAKLAFSLQLTACLGTAVAIGIGAMWGLRGTLAGLVVFNILIMIVTYHYVAKPLADTRVPALAAHILPELGSALTAFAIALGVAHWLHNPFASFAVYTAVGGVLYLCAELYFRKHLLDDFKSLALIKSKR